MIQGIDFSVWQDDNSTPQMMDCLKARQAGAEFCFIKSSQSCWLDSDFVVNVSVSSADRRGQKANGANLTIAEYVRRYGGKLLDGYMLRYIYFLDKSYRERLTVPEIPYAEIEKRNASMYRGQKPMMRGKGEIDNAPGANPEIDGASPIFPL